MEFDEEEWEFERPEEPEIWLVATRPVAAGDSLEIKEKYSNEQRLCKYGFVDINRRKECNNMRFEVRVVVVDVVDVVVAVVLDAFGTCCRPRKKQFYCAPGRAPCRPARSDVKPY